jgi:hypothetical protein
MDEQTELLQQKQEGDTTPPNVLFPCVTMQSRALVGKQHIQCYDVKL